MSKPENPSAFPAFVPGRQGFANIPTTTDEWLPGMTLRDYFAGQALIGVIGIAEKTNTPDNIARLAYGLADAMLAARQP
jgi:hypothetical protein